MVFPFDEVVQAVLVVAIKDRFEFPLWYDGAVVIPFEYSAAGVLSVLVVEAILAGEPGAICPASDLAGVESITNLDIWGQFNYHCAGIGSEDFIWADPVVVPLLLWPISFHVPCVNHDLVAGLILVRLVPSSRSILFVTILGLACEGLQLGEDTAEAVGDIVGFKVLPLLMLR